MQERYEFGFSQLPEAEYNDIMNVYAFSYDKKIRLYNNIFHYSLTIGICSFIYIIVNNFLFSGLTYNQNTLLLLITAVVTDFVISFSQTKINEYRDNNYFAANKQALVVDKLGMTFEYSSEAYDTKSSYKWSHLNFLIEDKFILFFINADIVGFVPKRLFATPAEQDAFRAFLQQNIKDAA